MSHHSGTAHACGVPESAAIPPALPAPRPPATGDLEETLRNSRAVRDGTVTAAVTITLHGEIAVGSLAGIQELLDAVSTTTTPIVVDLYHARCATSALLTTLCRFCENRHAAGVGCQLYGLHPGVIPDLDALSLTEVFRIYRDTDRPDRNHFEQDRHRLAP